MRAIAKWFGAVMIAMIAAGCAGDSMVVPNGEAAKSTTSSTMTVYISGFSQVRSDSWCTWYAVRSGGRAPFTYQWWPANGSTSDEYTGRFSSGSVYLDVLVTDADGQTAWASKYVTASPSTLPCMIM